MNDEDSEFDIATGFNQNLDNGDTTFLGFDPYKFKLSEPNSLEYKNEFPEVY